MPRRALWLFLRDQHEHCCQPDLHQQGRNAPKGIVVISTTLSSGCGRRCPACRNAPKGIVVISTCEVRLAQQVSTGRNAPKGIVVISTTLRGLVHYLRTGRRNAPKGIVVISTRPGRARAAERRNVS